MTEAVDPASFLPGEIANAITAFIAYVDEAERYRFVNDAYASMVGWPKSEILGRKIVEVVGEQSYAVVHTQIAAVLAGEIVEFEAMLTRLDGAQRHLEARYVPDFAADGTVRGFYALAMDRTEAKRAVARTHAMLDGMSDGFFALDPEWRFTYCNVAAAALGGVARETLLGQVYWEALPQVLGGPTEAALRAVMADRQPREFETTSVLTEADVLIRVFAVEDGIGVSFQDISERKRRAREEREHDERLKLALAASGLGHWTWDVGPGVVTFSDRAAEIFGVPPGPYKSWTDIVETLIHPDDRAASVQAVERAAYSREPYALEFRINRADDGELRWISVRAQTFYDEMGEEVQTTGVLGDSTAARTAADRERLLAREVDHRAKNALAVVQSLVRLTPFVSRDQFVATLTGRINAMARVHTLLSRNGWSGASVGDIVRQELAAFADGDRIKLDGPEVELRLEAAQPLSLLVHELTTNASKYGALSVNDGKVEISWALEEGGTLSFAWAETGGPAVTAPTKTGFGSKLIDGAASQLGGAIAREWAPGGLRCQVVVGDYQIKAAPPAEEVVPHRRSRPKRITGSRVLVVEDETLLAMEMCEHLTGAGAAVVGPAHTLEQGLALASSQTFDCAVLDINLGGKSVEPLVEMIRGLHLPFVLVTGYEEPGIAARVILRKPVVGEALLAALADQIAGNR
jgi:PAS domain S-box-containing protein